MRGETGFLSFSTLKHLFMRGFWKVFCVCVYFLSSKSHRLHLYVLISHFLFLQYCTTASINDKELENILLGLADTAQPRLGLSWNWTWWIEMWLKHQGLQSLGLENWRLDYNTAIWYLIPVCVNGSIPSWKRQCQIHQSLCFKCNQLLLQHNNTLAKCLHLVTCQHLNPSEHVLTRCWRKTT